MKTKRTNWAVAEVTAVGSSLIAVRLKNQLTLYARNTGQRVKLGDKVNIEVTKDNFWWSDVSDSAAPTFVAEIHSVC